VTEGVHARIVPMRYIYFSPHLDDAILSAGGLIYDQTQAGYAVEIWTFMCGFSEEAELTDFAKSLHAQWGTNSAEETIRIRRAEDQRAAVVVGAKAVYFDLLDCIYRRGKNGEALYSDIYVPLHEAEADLPARISQTMSAHLKPDDIVIVQLGIGRHLDHVTVRQAAEMLKRPLIYDADIPYLFHNPQDLAPKTAGMVDSVQPVSEAGLKVWQDAIEIYASQLSTLFDPPEAMRQEISGYWSERKGIRFWHPAQTN
jgi:LmbE family N-acetylglucosaminyl deacetylase